MIRFDSLNGYKKREQELINDELVESLLGDYLGEGAYRTVYMHRHRNDLVIKIDRSAASRRSVRQGFDIFEALDISANLKEWIVYKLLSHYSHIKNNSWGKKLQKHEKAFKLNKLWNWIAPCEYISKTGTVLFQKRIDPIKIKDLPKSVPLILRDRNADNFGYMYDGDGGYGTKKRVVCSDYGNVFIATDRTPQQPIQDILKDYLAANANNKTVGTWHI